MQYRLVAIDMDGTLLTPELDISRETVDAVRQAIDKQVMIILSTGRMYPAAMPFARQLQLDVPIITCNGALTKCSRTGKVYDVKTIPEEYCHEIIHYCSNAGLSLSVYKDDEIFIEKNSENISIHEGMDRSEPQEVDDLSTVVGGQVIKLLFDGRDKRSLEYHAQRLYEEYEGKLNFYFSLPYFVEIVNKHANKRKALEFLSAKYKIKREEIIAIGDNYNDMDMIQYAGLGVAMGNSPDYLKEAADFVTHSNDEDGVRHVLERFVLMTPQALERH